MEFIPTGRFVQLLRFLLIVGLCSESVHKLTPKQITFCKQQHGRREYFVDVGKGPNGFCGLPYLVLFSYLVCSELGVFDSLFMTLEQSCFSSFAFCASYSDDLPCQKEKSGHAPKQIILGQWPAALSGPIHYCIKPACS